MKRVVLVPILLLLAPAIVHAQVFTKAGITYFGHRGDSCPPLVLRQTGEYSFELGAEGNCFILEPSKSDYLFVLGVLEPGLYTIYRDQSPLNALYSTPPLVQFHVPPEESERLLVFQRTSEGLMTFHIAGVSPTIYIIERSTDLKVWTGIAQVTGESDFSFQEPQNATGAFYRVKIVEGPPTIVDRFPFE